MHKNDHLKPEHNKTYKTMTTLKQRSTSAQYCNNSLTTPATPATTNKPWTKKPTLSAKPPTQRLRKLFRHNKSRPNNHTSLTPLGNSYKPKTSYGAPSEQPRTRCNSDHSRTAARSKPGNRGQNRSNRTNKRNERSTKTSPPKSKQSPTKPSKPQAEDLRTVY